MPRFFTVGSIVGHAIVIGSVLAAQALAVGPLPAPTATLLFEGAVPVRIADIPLPPPPRAASGTSTPVDGTSVAPVEAPRAIGEERTSETLPSGAPDGAEVRAGVAGSIGGPVTTLERLPEPAPPSTPASPLHIGGTVAPPRKIAHVDPIYPAMARASHVSGPVILEATIDARGHVVDVRVLRSIALLDQAAVDAVRQWIFTPTLLNGVPVSVLMTVTVNFMLGQP